MLQYHSGKGGIRMDLNSSGSTILILYIYDSGLQIISTVALQ